jgi:wyosine [tRNA(Phe)-imidazoG37] synthetase (radical SAM superfamily)
MLFADEAGVLYDHPSLEAVIWDGHEHRPAGPGALRPAPTVGTSMVTLPGRRPVGYDRRSGRLEVVDAVRLGRGEKVRAVAVAAVFPAGWTRTAHPAYRAEPGAGPLPLYTYAAAGWGARGVVGAAIRTDPRRHWDPELFDTPDLARRIDARLAADPGNRVLRQLRRCALEYHCYTAQNTFYRRWEAALPVSAACDHRCLGCISGEDGAGHGCAPATPQARITSAPGLDECLRVAVPHLEGAGDGAIVSFGQGCEGEPTLEAELMAEVCRATRASTARGTLHVNSNGGRPAVFPMLRAAGLDSCRISLVSARAEVFEAYHRPSGHAFAEVARAIDEAKACGLFVSLNLLVLPGLTDRPAEVAALCELVARARPDCVQSRSLSADPERLLAALPGDGGAPLGVEALLRALADAAPWLKIGNYNVPREEWSRPLRPTWLSPRTA